MTFDDYEIFLFEEAVRSPGSAHSFVSTLDLPQQEAVYLINALNALPPPAASYWVTKFVLLLPARTFVYDATMITLHSTSGAVISAGLKQIVANVWISYSGAPSVQFEQFWKHRSYLDSGSYVREAGRPFELIR